MSATVTNEYLRKEFDNLEKTGELGNLIEELEYSTLIAPVNDDGSSCAMITMAGENYVPIFTDIHEFQKVDFKGDFHPEAFDFNFYLEQMKNGLSGLIVNVESERFPITRIFLDIMDTNYMFDLDYKPFTLNEIRKIYDSINNEEFEEFLKNDGHRWDLDSLMEILLKSDLLTLVGSQKSLDEFEENGVITINNHEGLSYCKTSDRCAVLFSSRDNVKFKPKNKIKTYSQLVNLGVFIDNVLKSDLAGIRLDGDIVFSRDFLMDFMKGFNSPCMDKFDDYLFRI